MHLVHEKIMQELMGPHRRLIMQSAGQALYSRNCGQDPSSAVEILHRQEFVFIWLHFQSPYF